MFVATSPFRIKVLSCSYELELIMANEQSHFRTIANQDGALIWRALERGEALETIAADLAGETGEQADSLKRDVLEFIDALKRHKLLFS
jgi:Coenzyme PQQ synthesis protein D (PqqD)